MSRRSSVTGEDLPQTVISLLASGKFLHLGTSKDNIPHVSLMNYTYVSAADAAPWEHEPVIIMATPRDTIKFENLQANPRVSLLVHDWTTASRASEAASSGLAQFLQDLNQSQLSSVSVTLTGLASILDNDKAESFFRDKLLAANTAEARCFIDDAALVLVKVDSATVADTHNKVQVYENIRG